MGLNEFLWIYTASETCFISNKFSNGYNFKTKERRKEARKRVEKKRENVLMGNRQIILAFYMLFNWFFEWVCGRTLETTRGVEPTGWATTLCEKFGVTLFNKGGMKQSRIGIHPWVSNRDLKWSNCIHGVRVDMDQHWADPGHLYYQKNSKGEYLTCQRIFFRIDTESQLPSPSPRRNKSWGINIYSWTEFDFLPFLEILVIQKAASLRLIYQCKLNYLCYDSSCVPFLRKGITHSWGQPSPDDLWLLAEEINLHPPVAEKHPRSQPRSYKGRFSSSHQE